MSKERTHWREAHESDYLASYDLDGAAHIHLTVKETRQELVKGDKGREDKCNVMHFKEEGYKPMILNATNGKMMRTLTGSNYIQDWKDIVVEIYVDPNVKFQGEITEGLRIRDKKIKPKPELLPGTPLWTKAVERLKAGESDIDHIKSLATLSAENEKKLLDESK